MQQGLMFHNSFEEVGIQVIKEISLLNVELMDHPFGYFGYSMGITMMRITENSEVGSDFFRNFGVE